MFRHILLSVVTLAFAMSVNAEKYQYNDYYFQRQSHFDELPVDTADIVFLGNSLTNGANWSEMFGGMRVLNRGIISDVIQGMADRTECITKGHPKKIFFLGGVNDISHKITADSVVKAIENLIIKLKTESPESEIFVQTMLPYNNDFKRYRNLIGTEPVVPAANKMLREVAERQGVTLIDLYPLFDNGEGKLYPDMTADGLHVNNKGYKVWRDAVAPYVAPGMKMPEKLYELTENDVIVAGNSLISGAEWCELLRYPVKVRRMGETCLGYAKSAANLAAAHPKKIFLQAAYNSMDASKLDGNAIVKTMSNAISEIKRISPSTEICVMGLLPVRSEYEGYESFKGRSADIAIINNRLREIAHRNGVKWINVFPLLADDNGELRSDFTNDGFHLMGPAYTVYGNVLRKYIK